MSKVKHTPLWNLDEWRNEAEEWRGSVIGEIEAEVLGDDFAACFQDGVIAGKAELAGNIVELVEALEECASHAGGDIGDIDWPMVRSAIAKARGENQHAK